MDFVNNKTKPISTRKNLRRQLEEQSPLCDFTVVRGSWSKRFHSCVLVGCLFFQCLLEQDFQEKIQGSVTLHIGTATTIEASLMFLYGKCPKVDMSNVSHFLEIADFLLMPNLKSLSVKFINGIQIKAENCMRILHLSSIYDFEVPNCKQYIRQHLDDILDKDELFQFTNDSLRTLFGDNTLSYVSMDIKFKYLLGWFKHDEMRRHESFRELLPLLNLTQVSRDTLEAAKSDHTIQKLMPQLDEVKVVDQTRNIEVLVSKSYTREAFWLYDLEGQTWHRIEGTGTFDGHNCRRASLQGGRSCNEAVVYLNISDYFNRDFIYTFDLESDNVKRTKVVSNVKEHRFRKTVSGFCYAIEEQWIHIDSGNDDLNQYNSTESMQYAYASQGGPSVFFSRNFTSCRRRVATLYVGNINHDGEDTIMDPVCSVREEIIAFSANSTGVVLMMPDSRRSVFLFDSRSCHLETKELPKYIGEDPQATNNGFVFIGNKEALYIVPFHGPSLKEKYLLQKIKLNDPAFENSTPCKYHCVGKWLVRYYNPCEFPQKVQETVQEYVLHKQVLSAKSVSDVTWIKMPLAREHLDDSIFTNMTTISLPRSMLRCHIECPHCECIEDEKEIRQGWIMVDDAYYSTPFSDSSSAYGEGDDYFYWSSD